MIQDPIRRTRIRSVLIIVILATIPCYLLGLLILWISNGTRSEGTPTPTITFEVSEPTVFMTATLPVPTLIFDTATITSTPTISLTPSATKTYTIPSSTPTITFTPSNTPTPTDTNTPEPISTDTPTIPPP